MKREAKQILDEEMANERKLGLYVSIFVVIFLIMISGLYIPYSSNNIYGKTITFTAEQTEEGSKPKAKIQLESGRTVIARHQKRLRFKYGEKVEVVERKTIIGRPRYEVLRYAP